MNGEDFFLFGEVYYLYKEAAFLLRGANSITTQKKGGQKQTNLLQVEGLIQTISSTNGDERPS